MARKKKPEEGKAFPLWQSTFSDLMNLLLCFFVLLFSMSSVDSAKYDQLVQSLNSTFSIMAGGAQSQDMGILISSGISQLNQLNQYYTNLGAENTSNEDGHKGGSGKSNQGNSDDPDSTATASGGTINNDNSSGSAINSNTASGAAVTTGSAISQEASTESAIAEYQRELQAAAEANYDKVSELMELYKLDENADINMDSMYNYVGININGAFLFDSGSADLKPGADKILKKAARILKSFKGSTIVIEGHTDNVPQTDIYRYKNNLWLSSARACTVLEYLVNEGGLDASTMSASGKGEYDPIASNKTAEGRQKNRRVEIKIYNKVGN